MAAHDAGSPIYPQVAARPFGMLLGFPGHHAFSKRPTYMALAARLSPAELATELQKPSVKAAILSEADVEPDPTVLFDGMNQLAQGMVNRTYPLGSPVDYEPTPDKTVAALAEAQGRDPLEALYDLYCEHDAGNMLMVPFFNYSHGNQDAVREMLLHPAGVAGLSDGGAHCGMICDASYPTYLLSFWAKGRTTARGSPSSTWSRSSPTTPRSSTGSPTAACWSRARRPTSTSSTWTASRSAVPTWPTTSPPRASGSSRAPRATPTPS